ncbi:NACHT domain-containing protein [Pedobacter sp. PWIIR3]
MHSQNPLADLNNLLNNFSVQSRIAHENKDDGFIELAEPFLMNLLNITLSAEFVPATSTLRNKLGVSLIDKRKRFGLCIVWGPNIAEVKETFVELVGSRFERSIEQVFTFVLTKKDPSGYSQVVFNRLKGSKVKFEEKQHIIDTTDIYRLLKGRQSSAIGRAIGILRKGFATIRYTPDFSEEDYKQFQRSYFSACSRNFGNINFFGLSVSRVQTEEIELNKIYVKPKFWVLEQTVSKTTINNHQSLMDIPVSGTRKAFSQLFSIDKHLVLLGKPGAGKSLLIKYAISSIVNKWESEFEAQSIYGHLPFVIELHKYNEFRKSKELGLREYLVHLLELQYQTSITKNNLNTIFSNFPTICFFDGLDEILNIQERTQVRNDIEIFLGHYRRGRSIVTSRYESYREVGMDKRYRLAEVLDFEDIQLKDYVRKWYGINERDISMRTSQIDSFMKEVASVEPELRFNPLLLALILIIYRNNKNRIPTTRYEIFAGCTSTMVFTRDKVLKKLFPRVNEADVMAVFSELAYWQFENERRQTIFDHQDVQYQIRSILSRNKSVPVDKLDKATTLFTYFANLRSIYIENRFSHKTFLEYFTASMAYKLCCGNISENSTQNYSTDYDNIKKKYTDFFAKRLSSSYWTVVLEVLICKIDIEQRLVPVWEIINELLEKETKDAVVFFLPVIKFFKNVDARSLIELLKTAIDFCLKRDESVFALLIFTYHTKPLRAYFLDALSMLMEDQSIALSDKIIFLYEFALAADDLSLSKLLSTSGISYEDEYPRVLIDYVQLIKDIDHLSSIISLKSLNETRHLLKEEFKSVYKRKIFFGHERFNYIVSFFTRRDLVDWESAYLLLVNKGVEIGLLTSAAESITMLDYSSGDIEHLIRKTKIQGFKEFLRVLKKRSKPDPEKQQLSKFFRPKRK